MTLPFVRWGSGAAQALFLHGFTGSKAAFAHLEPLLGDVLTATCVDLPGHGAVPRGTTWEAALDALEAHLVGPTVLVGYSQGARLALALAARRPERVERLVLESGSPGLRQRHARAQRRRADAELAALLRERGVDQFVDRWEQLPLFAGLRALPAVDREALRMRRASHTAEGLASALEALGQGAQPELWSALPSLRVPTLLLSGGNDLKYTRLARRMAAELPLAWRVTFRGCGHAPHLECPEAFARELRAFLAPAWRVDPQELAP
jgi:2-succinyl-6-hydroxy-2,4-cyclohexadiene-1-carboxylate synthase